VLTHQLDSDALVSDEVKAIADLCVHCHQCRLECPASVDIPKLMVEVKGAHVANHGLTFSDWVVARIDLVSRIGCWISPLANRLIANRQARWLGEKVFGIAQGRKIPRFAGRTFMSRARRRKLVRATRRTGPKVLYFVDTYANYHDPQLGDALVAVLEHNAVAVYVPPEQRASGMPLIAAGAIEDAKQIAADNIRMLADAVRQGYEIVATEPSAAMCLTREYPALLGDSDAQLVAEHSSEACTYLWRLHRSGRLGLDFTPLKLSVAYHMPCHLRALQVGSPGENLLRLIPGLRVQRVERGCSGMAGTYGLKRENYRTSLRAGLEMINGLRQCKVHFTTTECSACKIQIEQGTHKSAVHPLKLLAYAYGVMPLASELLEEQLPELTVS
jgi:anaerobic glycerol-3-phosphate dehydrogenase C subunit